MAQGYGPSWNISRPGPQCSCCQGTIGPGETCWAALTELPQTGRRAKVGAAEFQRLDYCEACWAKGQRPALPLVTFSHWRTLVPHPSQKKKIFVDDGVLVDLFQRLADRQELEDLRLRFVLGLILMRKRLLRYEGMDRLALPDGQVRETWRMILRIPSASPEAQVDPGAETGGEEAPAKSEGKAKAAAKHLPALLVNPQLTAEQIGEVSKQLSGILAEEV